ncbi:MAG TPA: 30S ribosomal protein S17 [Phycisphaerales bacterium]|nr:30S ribosomal protein S17 [Phycisphaerales bacterium]
MAEAQKTIQGSRSQKLTGTVRTKSGQKTINVVVENVVKHAQYGKFMRQRTKLAVHDPEGQANVGDQVEIVQCRPISKTKSWRLLRVLRGAQLPVE